MQVKLIIRILSLLSLLVATLIIPCIGTSIFYSENDALSAFVTSFIILFIPAIVILFATRGKYDRGFSVRGAFLLVFLVWAGISLFSSIPYYFSENLHNWTDAVFEATSGITSTGATLIKDVESADKSILLWRSITHWVGGMGIIVLSIALFPLLGIGASGLQVYKAEISGISLSKVTPRITQTAKILWLIYCGLTLIFFVLYKVGGMQTFDAINHTLSAISTGGFSTKNASIGHYNSAYFDWVTVGAMFVASVSFVIFYRMFTSGPKTLVKSSELKAYVLILISAAMVITLVNYNNNIYDTIVENVRYAVFQVVSISSTTAFTTTDFSLWPNVSQFILLFLFFTGGCAGSTAGGFKVVRLVVLFKQAINELKLLVHPRGVFLIRLNGASINKEVVYGISGFLFLYLFSVFLVSLVAATAEVDLITAISTGFSIIGNVGAGFGAVGPSGGFSIYPAYVKWALSLGMIIGRLEVYTFFILLMPFFWRK